MSVRLAAPRPGPRGAEGEPRDHAAGSQPRRGGDQSSACMVVDGHAIPLAAVVSAGQTHESTKFVELMEKVRPPRWTGWPLKTAGDKGYSYPRVRGMAGAVAASRRSFHNGATRSSTRAGGRWTARPTDAAPRWRTAWAG